MPGRGRSGRLCHGRLSPWDVAQGAASRRHTRALPLRAASRAGERAISLSLPRSNGATQSGGAIIASTMQFPLSIIYSIRCAGKEGETARQIFDRRDGEPPRGQRGRAEPAGFGFFSPGIPRAPRPSQASPAGAWRDGRLRLPVPVPVPVLPVPVSPTGAEPPPGRPGLSWSTRARRKSPV